MHCISRHRLRAGVCMAIIPDRTRSGVSMVANTSIHAGCGCFQFDLPSELAALTRPGHVALRQSVSSHFWELICCSVQCRCYSGSGSHAACVERQCVCPNVSWERSASGARVGRTEGCSGVWSDCARAAGAVHNAAMGKSTGGTRNRSSGCKQVRGSSQPLAYIVAQIETMHKKQQLSGVSHRPLAGTVRTRQQRTLHIANLHMMWLL
jgi:hypothetical protein